jgi:hypothetical protein
MDIYYKYIIDSVHTFGGEIILSNIDDIIIEKKLPENIQVKAESEITCIIINYFTNNETNNFKIKVII